MIPRSLLLLIQIHRGTHGVRCCDISTDSVVEGYVEEEERRSLGCSLFTSETWCPASTQSNPSTPVLGLGLALTWKTVSCAAVRAVVWAIWIPGETILSATHTTRAAPLTDRRRNQSYNIPVAPVPTTATLFPFTSIPSLGQKLEWHTVPLNPSKPSQSGKCLLAAKPVQHRKNRHFTTNPVSHVTIHRSSLSSNLAPTTFVPKIQSFVTPNTLSTWSKYRRSSTWSG